MTQTKHTPGPWRAVAQKMTGHMFVERDLGNKNLPYAANNTLSESRLLIASIESGEAESNARLIAAAPDLLEALAFLVRVCESEPEACGIYKAHIAQARAAIAKAKGE